MIDKKFRLFGVIGIADLLLAALLIVFVILALRFSAPQSVSAKPGDTQVQYTIELYKKEPSFKDKVKVGTKIYDSLKGYEIGTIIDVYTEPYKEDVSDYDRGILTRAEVEGLDYVYVVVQANAQITDQATLIGQYEIMVGKDVFVKSRDFAAGGFIVVIDGVK